MATVASLVQCLLTNCQISFDLSSYSWEREPGHAVLCEPVHTDHTFLACPMGWLSLDHVSSLGPSVVPGLGVSLGESGGRENMQVYWTEPVGHGTAGASRKRADWLLSVKRRSGLRRQIYQHVQCKVRLT